MDADNPRIGVALTLNSQNLAIHISFENSSFVAQGDHGIDAYRAARGDVAGEQRDKRQ
jgi:hypothetical protein